jgi:hypothetical protein
LAPFAVEEEFRSLNDVLRQVCTYLMTNKRSLLKVVIYAVYLVLFLKRIAFVVKCSRDKLGKFLKKQLRNFT